MTQHSTPRTPQQRQLVKNSLASYARFLVACVILAALTPWTVRMLGDEGYGVWVLLLAISGYLELLDLGLMAATVKFVSASANDDLSTRQSVVATLARRYVRTTLLTLLVSLVAYTVFAVIYPLPNQLRQEAMFAAIAVSLRIVVQLPGSLAAGILSAHERLDIVQGLRTISLVFAATLQIVSLTAGWGLLGLALSQTLAALLETLAFWYLALARYPESRRPFASPQTSLLAALNHFSLWSVVLNLSAVVIARTDPLLIGLVLPLSAVTLYSVPLRIAEQLLLVAKQSINCFTPIFARLHRENRHDELSREYRRSLGQAYGVAIGFIIPTMWFASALLSAWMGSEFGTGANVLRWLLLAVLARVAQEVAGNLLGMTGAIRIVALGMAATAGLNLTLSVLLLRVWGSDGVAAATFLATAIAGCGLVVVYAHRSLDLSSLAEVRALAIGLVIPVAAQTAFLSVCSLVFSPQSLAQLIVVCGTAVTLYALILPTSPLRRRLSRLIESRVSRQTTVDSDVRSRSRQGAGTR